MSVVRMLTTVDNPFDPFTQFDQWYEWDERSGYRTSGLLARIVTTSDELSEVDQELAIDQAMQQVADLNVSGMHRIVTQG
jgi:hypothetical protein